MTIEATLIPIVESNDLLWLKVRQVEFTVMGGVYHVVTLCSR